MRSKKQTHRKVEEGRKTARLIIGIDPAAPMKSRCYSREVGRLCPDDVKSLHSRAGIAIPGKLPPPPKISRFYKEGGSLRRIRTVLYKLVLPRRGF